MQLIASIDAYPPSKRRSSDLEDTNGHVVRVLNEMYSNREVPAGDEDPMAEFILGGWSWRASSFRIWHVNWDPNMKQFQSKAIRPLTHRPGAWFWFAGSKDAVFDARLKLEGMLHASGAPSDAPLDLQPLTIIAKYCQDRTFRDVGGAPQVAKVYQHMNTKQFAVSWKQDPTGPASLHLAGRPLLSYEIAHLPEIKFPQ